MLLLFCHIVNGYLDLPVTVTNIFACYSFLQVKLSKFIVLLFKEHPLEFSLTSIYRSVFVYLRKISIFLLFFKGSFIICTILDWQFSLANTPMVSFGFHCCQGSCQCNCHLFFRFLYFSA